MHFGQYPDNYWPGSVVVMTYSVTTVYQAMNDHADNQGLDDRHDVISFQTEHGFRQQVAAHGCQ